MASNAAGGFDNLAGSNCNEDTVTVTGGGGGSSNSNESPKLVSPSVNGETIMMSSIESDVPAATQNSESFGSQQYPHTLLHEFDLLNFDIPNVYVQKMDAVRRTCQVTAVCGSFHVHLSMHFPDAYPNNAEPSFVLTSETTLDNSQQSRLIKVLHNTSLQHVKHNRSCIEPCLRQLIVCLTTLQDESHNSSPDTPPELASARQSITLRMPTFLSLHSIDYLRTMSVPFPRTSGARFCAAGYLVCFTRRIVEVQRAGSNQQRSTSTTADVLPTPRAMSALSELSQATPIKPLIGHQYNYNYSSTVIARSLPNESALPSISEYYNYKDQARPPQPKPSKAKVKTVRSSSEVSNDSDLKDSERNKQLVTGPVVIYNILCILPISRQLAEEYVFDNDYNKMCQHNAFVAGSMGRTDLVQTWTLVAQCKEHLVACQSYGANVPWAEDAFGQQLFQSLIHHYSALHDVQTLAMISCVLGTKARTTEHLNKSSISVTLAPLMSSNLFINGAIPLNYKTYHTIHPSDTSLKGWNYTVSKLRRSNSWSDAYEDLTANADSSSLSELSKETIYEEMSSFTPKVIFFKSKNPDLCVKSVSDPLYAKCELFKKVYANMLFQFGLNDKRAELLKYVSTTHHQQHVGLDVAVLCKTCGKRMSSSISAKCSTCQNSSMTCVVCRISIRGLSSVCLNCCHGGHTTHISDWFANHNECPSGCGCHCVFHR